jgi:hypothetical protein
MSLLMVNQGEAYLLEYLVNKTAPDTLKLKLFKNDKTPADGDTEAGYTEATFTGYASVTLTGASWTITAGAPSEAAYAQQVFTSTANQTLENVYGYYVVRTSDNKLMWAERFTDGPYPIQNNNDSIRVTPKIQARKHGED